MPFLKYSWRVRYIVTLSVHVSVCVPVGLPTKTLFAWLTLSAWLTVCLSDCLCLTVSQSDSRSLGISDCLSIWRSDFLSDGQTRLSDCVPNVWLPRFQIQGLVSVHACSRLNSASRITTNVKMMETVTLERSAAAILVSADVWIQVLKELAVS